MIKTKLFIGIGIIIFIGFSICTFFLGKKYGVKIHNKDVQKQFCQVIYTNTEDYIKCCNDSLDKVLKEYKKIFWYEM